MSARHSPPPATIKTSAVSLEPSQEKSRKKKIASALLRACALPGWGHIYAGSSGLGWTLVLASLASLLVFMRALFISAQIMAAQLFAYLDTDPSSAGPSQVPVGQLIASVATLYLLLLISFTHCADWLGRRDTTRPGLWTAGLSSWLCPGSGQLLCRQRLLGSLLIAAYLLGMAATYPSYRDLIQGALALVHDMRGISLASAERLGDAVHGLTMEVDLGPGRLLQRMSTTISLLLVFAALRADFVSVRRRPARMAAQLLVGWLAPGSGQVVDGRHRAAAVFAALYLASLLLTAVLFKSGLISVAGADRMGDATQLIVLVAMLEAPLMALLRRSS